MSIPREFSESEICVGNTFGQGGFSDVKSGQWADTNLHGSASLAVKFFRQILKDDDVEQCRRLQRRFRNETTTWMRAQPHPNILPFLGVYVHDSNLLPALISPLREGDVLDYISKNDVDICSVAIGIACGLSHLHAHEIIHGDLTPKNVLMRLDANGNAVPELSDFGRAKILNVRGFTGSLNATRRYTAPEVLFNGYTLDDPVIKVPKDRENEILSKVSDVWSLGMVLLHILSGVEPYCGLNETHIVLWHYQHKEPEPKEHPHMNTCPFRMGVWSLLRRCWEIGKHPNERCTARYCYETLATSKPRVSRN